MRSGNDADRGLYRKFEVIRTDGSSEPGGKHAGCRYFVLDLEHDEFAPAALDAYAAACEAKFPLLARDLRARDWSAMAEPTRLTPEKVAALVARADAALRLRGGDEFGLIRQLRDALLSLSPPPAPVGERAELVRELRSYKTGDVLLEWFGRTEPRPDGGYTFAQIADLSNIISNLLDRAADALASPQAAAEPGGQSELAKALRTAVADSPDGWFLLKLNHDDADTLLAALEAQEKP